MRIVYVTTQSLDQSTLAGRIVPLALLQAHDHDVHIIVHKSDGTHAKPKTPSVTVHTRGVNPFSRSQNGKKRYSGIRLILRMGINAVQTCITLVSIRPDIVVIVKPLPENTLATLMWRIMTPFTRRRIILDIDDFELTANKLTSTMQRAAVHWSERVCARLATSVVAASPFLKDHMQSLGHKRTFFIPTGISSDTPKKSLTPLSSPCMTYIGSVSLASGHRVDMLPDILEYVAKHIPNIRMRIAGSGDDIEKLKTTFKAKGLEDRVVWSGRFSSNDVQEIIRDTSVYLDPVDDSISNRAKSSYRVMLAAISGTPVVTSDIGIRPYLLPDELHNMSFAKPLDPASYAQAAVQYVQKGIDKKEHQAMIKKANQYTWPQLAQAYNKAIL